jgi:RimJ/RimL family protein N-acetyltransferase
MELRTPRLLLREYTPDDWEAVHRYASLPEVMRFITYRPNTEDDTRDFIRRVVDLAAEDPREKWEMAVVDADAGGVLIGGCGYWWTDRETQEAEIGYLFHPDVWRNGYATEVAQALIAFGFTQLGAHRITARCNADNPASARVMEKCGMQREAHFRRRLWGHGRWWDEFVYAILDEGWKRSA